MKDLAKDGKNLDLQGSCLPNYWSGEETERSKSESKFPKLL